MELFSVPTPISSAPLSLPYGDQIQIASGESDNNCIKELQQDLLRHRDDVRGRRRTVSRLF